VDSASIPAAAVEIASSTADTSHSDAANLPDSPLSITTNASAGSATHPYVCSSLTSPPSSIAPAATAAAAFAEAHPNARTSLLACDGGLIQLGRSEQASCALLVRIHRERGASGSYVKVPFTEREIQSWRLGVQQGAEKLEAPDVVSAIQVQCQD
jgi:hypothetical protein